MALFGNDQQCKVDRFVFSSPHDQVKCVVVLTGDSITNAVSFHFQLITIIKNNHQLYIFNFKSYNFRNVMREIYLRNS